MLKHYYHKHDDDSVGIYGGTNQRAQSFTPDTSFTCSGISVFFRITGIPAGTLSLNLYLADGSGNPMGGALRTATVAYDSGIDGVYPGCPLRFVFDVGYYLQASTQYVFVVSLSGGSVSSCLNPLFKTVGDYAGGNAKTSTNGGASWTDTGHDLVFDLWDQIDINVSYLFAVASNVGGGNASRLFKIYRDGGGHSTIAQAISATGNYGTDIKKSSTHFYWVTSINTGGTIRRYTPDLVYDAGWGSNSTGRALNQFDVSDDNYIVFAGMYTTGFWMLKDEAWTTLASVTAPTGYGMNGAWVGNNGCDFAIACGGNGAGGWQNGTRYKKTDGTNLFSYWSNGQTLGRCTGDHVTGDAFNINGSPYNTIRRYKYNADAYWWQCTLSPATGGITDLVYDSETNLLFLACDKGAASYSLTRVIGSTVGGGTQGITYDTGANSKCVRLTRAGTLLVGGVSGTDEDAGLSTLRELDTDFNVIWRFDSNFTTTISGVVEAVVNFVQIAPRVEGEGTVLGWPGNPISPVSYVPIPLFPLGVRPETPLLEHLQFMTKIHRRLNGTEQRLVLRKCPRILLEASFADKRQTVESYLYDRAMDHMAVPFWHEPAFVVTPVVGGDDHAHVNTTALSQFKVGEYAMVVGPDGSWEAREVASFTADTIVFTDDLAGSYDVKSEVLPLYRCWAENIRVDKVQDWAQYDMKLLVQPVDNNLGLAPYIDGELILTTVNALSHLQQSWTRPHYRVDGHTGLVNNSCLLTHADQGSMLGWVTHNRTELWELRQLLYRLCGKGVAFNLASFQRELIANQNLAMGSTALNVENCGYTEFVQNRRGTLRVVLLDGTVMSKTVVSSRVMSPSTERITVNSVWPSTIAPSQIDRIEYLDLVRLDTDDVVIKHRNAIGWASCEVPIVHVYPQLAEE